uniref:Uncharacterized protein n=1 Tax=Panagrolaimus sp. JU765 TaxID=591449 RepID=A0AC34RE67_9BILA
MASYAAPREISHYMPSANNNTTTNQQYVGFADDYAKLYIGDVAEGHRYTYANYRQPMEPTRPVVVVPTTYMNQQRMSLRPGSGFRQNARPSPMKRIALNGNTCRSITLVNRRDALASKRDRLSTLKYLKFIFDMFGTINIDGQELTTFPPELLVEMTNHENEIKVLEAAEAKTPSTPPSVGPIRSRLIGDKNARLISSYSIGPPNNAMIRIGTRTMPTVTTTTANII